MNEDWIIEKYRHELKQEWDNFVDASRNGTFLLRRDYMDYHSDRFTDCSLMIYKGQKLIALLPASAHGDEVRSHGGLTYGGFIIGYSSDFSAGAAVDVLGSVIGHYRNRGFSSMLYKTIPHIYHKYPSEEDIYAIFRHGGQLEECNISSTIDLTCPIRFNENCRRNIRKCTNAGIYVRETESYNDYWALLSKLLKERYSALPVHSLEEISQLHKSFPNNIRLFCGYAPNGEILAGVVCYLCDQCVHCQYIASSEEGKKLGVLALIMEYIICKFQNRIRYFDFGISNEKHGQYLNVGLLDQKNRMGGRAVAYQIYRLKFCVS